MESDLDIASDIRKLQKFCQHVIKTIIESEIL